MRPSSFFRMGASCGFRMVLRARDDCSCGKATQGFHHQGGAHFGQSSRKLGCRFRGTDFEFTLEKHVACVHARVNAHGSGAGFCFAVDEGPVDGRGPAIFWESGSVQVDPAELGDRQQSGGDDLSVGDDNDAVGKALQEILGFRCANFLRLEHGNVRGESRFLHGRKRDFVAAPARAGGPAG